MKKIYKYVLAISVIGFLGLSTACNDGDKDSLYTDDPGTAVKQGTYNEAKAKTWDFNTLDGWVHANQGENADVPQSFIEDGRLKIFTHARTQERKKVRTPQQYGAGRYIWRVYVSDLGMGDRASIGAWLYNDDEHEIDFEIGSGTAADRAELNAADDEVVAYMTTQANPHNHVKTKIKKNAWHTFEIDLSLVDGKYLVKWIIDGAPAVLIQQTFGEEYPFFIFCSVENLKFVGDHWPKQDNYALYDYVKYIPYDYAMEPVTPTDPSDPVDPDPEPMPDETVTWDFNNIDGWQQSSNIGADGKDFIKFENGIVSLTIDPAYVGMSRNNLESLTAYGAGKYVWKVIIPEMETAARFTTGGMLYTSNEDKGYHALGMTVMYGTTGNRADYSIPADKLVLRLSSDQSPEMEVYKPIAPGEYEFAIELTVVDGKYKASWLLDGESIYTKDLWYGPSDVNFKIICSSGQLKWWGDKDMTRSNTGKFDYVKYTSY